MIGSILGDKVPEDNKQWKLLTKLEEILRILYRSNIDELSCSKLQASIKEHDTLFKLLYPEKNLKKNIII